MTALVQKIESLHTDISDEKFNLLRNTICKGLTNDEIMIFAHVCKKTGLDAYIKQIYPVKRWDSNLGKETLSIQTGIDGYRLIAERTKKYSPGKEPTFQYDKEGNIISATAYIKKQTADGTWHEISATAYWKEYVQKTKEGKVSKFWNNMPHGQIAKCAEALALRKAFPAEMSGLYIKEEMDQAGSITIEKEVIEKKEPENFHEIVDKFFWQFPAEEHNNIQIYLEKYCGHYKKEMWETLEIYNDKEDFLKAYNSWKTKHGITA